MLEDEMRGAYAWQHLAGTCDLLGIRVPAQYLACW